MKTFIVTTTLSKSIDEVRFKLAYDFFLKALRKAQANPSDFEVVLVDASPDAAVQKKFREFEKLGLYYFRQLGHGMGPQRRQLFRHVATIARKQGLTEYIVVWTEPEKVDIVRFIPKIVAPIIKGQADIVIPHRTQASLKTYPVFQIASEKKANAVYRQATGLDIDMMFAVVAWHSRVHRYFAQCYPEKLGLLPPEKFDNYLQHYAPLHALADGYRLKSVTVDFKYPPAQKRNEETADREAMLKKRQWQSDLLTHAYQTILPYLEAQKS